MVGFRIKFKHEMCVFVILCLTQMLVKLCQKFRISKPAYIVPCVFFNNCFVFLGCDTMVQGTWSADGGLLCHPCRHLGLWLHLCWALSQKTNFCWTVWNGPGTSSKVNLQLHMAVGNSITGKNQPIGWMFSNLDHDLSTRLKVHQSGHDKSII